MDGQLFLRVRGRVLGPYDQEKLQALVRRGQLSRMHELSADGVNWTRASTFSELFVSEVIVSRPAEAALTEAAPADTLLIGGEEKPQDQWHYSSAGVERGPVDYFNLQMLAGTGQLLPTDMVWTQGMGDWLPAEHIPGLLRNTAATNGQTAAGDAKTDKAGELAALARAAGGSRPWATFIAVMLFIWAALCEIGGIFELLGGTSVHATPVVAAGLFAMVDGLLYAVGGYLLLSYANQLNSLRLKPQVGGLTKALDSLRAFWIFTSIVIIVFTAFALFVVIWVLAIGATLPGLPRR